MGRLLGVKELAERLNLSVRTVEQLHAERRLPVPVRLGRVRRWDEVEVDTWLKEQFQMARQAATAKQLEEKT